MDDLAIAKLRLQPGDILVVRASGVLSQAAGACVSAAVKGAIERAGVADRIGVLVIDENTSLGVLQWLGPAPNPS